LGLYWLVTGVALVSWRVRHGTLPGLSAKGERVLVNRLMNGLRLPLTDIRLTKGRLPRPGELIVYGSDAGGKTGPEFRLGRVVGAPGQSLNQNEGECRVEGTVVGAALGELPRNAHCVPDGGVIVQPDVSAVEQAPVKLEWAPEEEIVGNVVSVWWPLHRARAVRAQPAASKSPT
jgi:hypothetical protein